MAGRKEGRENLFHFPPELRRRAANHPLPSALPKELRPGLGATDRFPRSPFSCLPITDGKQWQRSAVTRAALVASGSLNAKEIRGAAGGWWGMGKAIQLLLLTLHTRPALSYSSDPRSFSSQSLLRPSLALSIHLCPIPFLCAAVIFPKKWQAFFTPLRAVWHGGAFLCFQRRRRQCRPPRRLR